MNQTADGRDLSEEELFFYEDQVCGEAEAVYRFCMSMTFNPDTAYNMLEATMKSAAREIKALMLLSGGDLRAKLLQLAYAQVDHFKQGNPGHTRLMSFLNKLERKPRAVIVAKDMGGLTAEQTAEVVRVGVEEVREILADARGGLVESFGS